MTIFVLTPGQRAVANTSITPHLTFGIPVGNHDAGIDELQIFDTRESEPFVSQHTFDHSGKVTAEPKSIELPAPPADTEVKNVVAGENGALSVFLESKTNQDIFLWRRASDAEQFAASPSPIRDPKLKNIKHISLPGTFTSTHGDGYFYDAFKKSWSSLGSYWSFYNGENTPIPVKTPKHSSLSIIKLFEEKKSGNLMAFYSLRSSENGAYSYYVKTIFPTVGKERLLFSSLTDRLAGTGPAEIIRPNGETALLFATNNKDGSYTRHSIYYWDASLKLAPKIIGRVFRASLNPIDGAFAAIPDEDGRV